MKTPTHHTMNCPECGASIRLPIKMVERTSPPATPGTLHYDLTVDTTKLREHMVHVHRITDRPTREGTADHE